MLIWLLLIILITTKWKWSKISKVQMCAVLRNSKKHDFSFSLAGPQPSRAETRPGEPKKLMQLLCSWNFPTGLPGQCLNKVIYRIAECPAPTGTFILPFQKQVEVWSFVFMIMKCTLASRMRERLVLSVNSSITLTSELLNGCYQMKITNFELEENLKYGYTLRGLPVMANEN